MNILRRIKLIAQRKRYVDIHITDHCNLNCRGCAHFSSISDEFYIRLDALENTYKKLQPIYHTFFNSIHLLGGEPLLHNDLENILLLTRKYFPDTEIQLVTNGLKLPKMSDSFWKICKDNHITIYVSKYHTNFDYKQLSELCQKHKVPCRMENYRDEFVHHVLDTDGKQKPSRSYARCKYGGSCIQLRDNCLYLCPQAAYVDILNKRFHTSFKREAKDSLPLEQLQHRWQMALFLLFPSPFCRYCNMDKEHYESWGISQKQKGEWIDL